MVQKAIPHIPNFPIFCRGEKKKGKYKQKHSGGVQVQVRWNPEQSDLVGVNSIHGRGLELDDF